MQTRESVEFYRIDHMQLTGSVLFFLLFICAHCHSTNAHTQPETLNDHTDNTKNMQQEWHMCFIWHGHKTSGAILFHNRAKIQRNYSIHALPQKRKTNRMSQFVRWQMRLGVWLNRKSEHTEWFDAQIASVLQQFVCVCLSVDGCVKEVII